MSTINPAVNGEPGVGSGGASAIPGTGNAAADEHAAITGVAGETSFDAVITRVLDASDVANKTASIAADSTGQLIAATAAMREAAQKSHMHSIIVLGISGFALVAAVGQKFREGFAGGRFARFIKGDHRGTLWDFRCDARGLLRLALLGICCS